MSRSHKKHCGSSVVYGGSCWMYSGFEHYYFEQTHPHWRWLTTEIPTREEAWKEWVVMMIGK